jgi:hypothetical protein
MAGDRITEQQFMAYLDRLLAGEDINSFQGISDEVRSDLEFARLMMARREDPYPAFRDQLKQRLLDKLASQKVEKPPGFWERFGSISQQKMVIGLASTAAVVLLLLFGVYINNIVTTSLSESVNRAAAPLPAAVLPPGNYAINLPQRIVPANISYTAQTAFSTGTASVPVYQVTAPAVTADSVTALSLRLGMKGQAAATDDGNRLVVVDSSESNQKQLTVWKATGAVEYGLTDTGKLYSKPAVPLPSETDAKKIAYDLLDKASLLTPDMGQYASVEKNITIASGGFNTGAGIAAAPSAKMDASYWLVSLPYTIGGMPATGPGSKIEVTVGGGGEVTRMLWTWRTVQAVFTGNTRSEQDAYKQLTSGGGSMDIPMNSSSLIIKKVKLSYWIDNYTVKQDYILPVYEFSGDCLDKNGRLLEQFNGWVPAIY